MDQDRRVFSGSAVHESLKTLGCRISLFSHPPHPPILSFCFSSLLAEPASTPLLLGNTHESFSMLPTMKVTILSAILALSLSAHALSNGFVGCYSSSGSLVNKGSSEFQSTGLCTSTCGRNGARYAATTNSVDCYCGSSLPPSAKLVSQSECNINCPGFPEDHCKCRHSMPITLRYLISLTLRLRRM